MMMGLLGASLLIQYTGGPGMALATIIGAFLLVALLARK